MRTCRLVTAGECGSRPNAMRNVYEEKESGNRQSHGPGRMSNKELRAERHRKILCTAQLVSAREIRVRLQ
jgi:hypothetical protein